MTKFMKVAVYAGLAALESEIRVVDAVGALPPVEVEMLPRHSDDASPPVPSETVDEAITDVAGFTWNLSGCDWASFEKFAEELANTVFEGVDNADNSSEPPKIVHFSGQELFELKGHKGPVRFFNCSIR